MMCVYIMIKLQAKLLASYHIYHLPSVTTAKLLLEQTSPVLEDSLNTSVSSPMTLNGITLSTV